MMLKMFIWTAYYNVFIGEAIRLRKWISRVQVFVNNVIAGTVKRERPEDLDLHM